MINSDVSAELEESFSSSISPQKAKFSIRLTAAAIDFGLIGATHFIFILLTGLQVAASIPLNFSIMTQTAIVGFFVFFLAPLTLTMFYFTIFHTCGGQTPGKMIMGVRVVAAENGYLSLGKSFLRWVGYFISALPIAAGFLWSVLDKAHRTWHDLLVGSIVIVTKPE